MIEHNENDAALQHVLIALGSANPDPYFGERVRRKIAARQLSRASRRRTVWAFGYAAATATLLLACFPLVYQLHHGAKLKGSTGKPFATPEATLAPPVAPPSRRRHPSPGRTVALQREPAPTRAMPDSYPAPEAPLNEQERLLLKLAHRSDRNELAMLTPTAFAADEARGDAEFREFFKSPPPPADPVAPTQADPTVLPQPDQAAQPQASSTRTQKDGAPQ